MRKEPTEAEEKLWSRLRAGRLEGWKFRSQTPIGPYIADFVCPAAKLIVEIDGGQHADQQDYDNRRTRFFENEGCRLVRFWNNDVLQNLEGVLTAILAAFMPPLPGLRPVPLPLRERVK
jgi:adenine-specific DNA-methyltransferase